MYKALYLSPMIPSFDLAETTRFFKDLLQFRTGIEESNYVILHKDNLTIHILPAGKEIGQMEFYLEVDNLDEVWNFIKDKLSDIKYREPFDREYGMREIHIGIPKTNALLFIGQETKHGFASLNDW